MRIAGDPGMLQRDGAGAFGAAPVPANQRNRRGTAQPMPYEVAWDASLDEGDGAWKIFLPNEHLLMVGTDYVIPNGTKAIPDIECWMQLDEIQADSDHVWLNVTINETGPSSAVFEPSDKTDNAAGIVGICIAEIAYDEETSSATVKQSVVGNIALQNGCVGTDPDDVSIDRVPHDNSDGADNTKEGQLEIKGWRDESNDVMDDSIAQILVGQHCACVDEYLNAVTRSRGDLPPKYIPIGKLPGLTTTIDAIDKIEFKNEGGTWKIVASGNTLEFSCGLLMSCMPKNIISTIDTVAHDSVYPGN